MTDRQKTDKTSRPSEVDQKPEPEPRKRGSILVTGDVIRDVYVYKGDRTLPAQKGKVQPHVKDHAGGARTLYELLRKTTPAQTRWGLREERKLGQLQPVHTLWVPCRGGTLEEHRNAGKGKEPKDVWRVGDPLGYDLGTTCWKALPKSPAAEQQHDVLVLDDAALAFRASPASRTSWPTGVAVEERQPAWIIHKMANPIAQGDLWRELVGGKTQRRRENLVVVVAADELRRAGTAISRGFSWERTVTELCMELDNNPAFRPLIRFSRYLVVNFGCVGTVWFDCAVEDTGSEAGGHGGTRATLVYDPSLPEGGWKTLLADDHAVYGHLNAFTAGIALVAAGTAAGAPLNLNDAVARGMAASRQLRLLGHGEVQEPSPQVPYAELSAVLSNPSDSAPFKEAAAAVAPNGFVVTPVPCCVLSPSLLDSWTLAALAENPVARPGLPLFGLANRLALYGEPSLARIPQARFGAMLSIDREEMETLRGLYQLAKRYVAQERPKQPLSIAAFGPPGAGKSFGIKEIAKETIDRDVPILEFNLSQFSSPEDVFGAFHQVQDKVLKGFVPVVFWDEFDSQSYRWLQYLLAPMQDGTFEEKGHTHTIGKCVFVFAGATSWDFEHFGPAPMPDDWPGSASEAAELPSDTPAAQLATFYRNNPGREAEDTAANSDFRLKKGPDFLSRLDGYINVLGPNQRLRYDWRTRSWATADPLDITYPVRRAILLRQFLGAKKPKSELPIDRNLLRAFLYLPRYHYGVRSLEKVARPLGQSDPPFRRAHLPPPQVLAQHLDSPAEFDRIYQDPWLLLEDAVVEALANAIHGYYNQANPSYATPFSSLRTFAQQSNRAAAIRIPLVLSLGGLRLRPRVQPYARPDLNDPAAVAATLSAPPSYAEAEVDKYLRSHLDDLAEEEHRLWMQFHEENGWRYGYKKPVVVPSGYEKDADRLLHPCLKPFHLMPDDYGQRKTWQDFDRNAIRSYPKILRLTDFEISFG